MSLAVLIRNPFHRLKLRCWKGCHPSKDSRGTFPAPRGHRNPLSPASPGVPPTSLSSSPLVTSLTFSAFTDTWLPLTRTILPWSCKDPCDYTGCTDNPGRSPHLQTLSYHRCKLVTVALLLLLLSIHLMRFLN